MASNRTIFTYRDPWGSEHELALVRTIYQMTGNLAVEALVAVNLGRLPEPDLAFLDTNNMSKELVETLDSLGVYEYTGRKARSGYCEYPLVRFTEDAMGAMRRR